MVRIFLYVFGVLAILAVGGYLLIKNVDFTPEESSKSKITDEINDIGARAVYYYGRAKDLQGGEKSFIGFSIPEELKKTELALYQITVLDSQKLVLAGIPNETAYPWYIETTVTPPENILSVVKQKK